MNLETHHPLLAMEANSDALFEFLIGGLGNHLTATPEYGICQWEKKIVSVHWEQNIKEKKMWRTDGKYVGQGWSYMLFFFLHAFFYRLKLAIYCLLA